MAGGGGRMSGVAVVLRAVVGLVAVVLPVLAGARAGAAGETVDFPVFVGGYGIAFFEGVAARYAEERPGRAVRVYGDARIADKVSLRLLEGRPPDATDANLPWARLIRAGVVLDLTEALEGPDWEGRGRWRDSFIPGALDRWTEDGRVYGVPFAHAVWVFFYNQALFRDLGIEAPATWEAFEAVCVRLREAGVAPVAFPGQARRYIDPVWRAAYFNLAGREAFEAFMRLEPGAWRDPRLVRSLAVVGHLAREHFVEGWEGMSHTGAQEAFLLGRAGMTISASWLANEMRSRIPEGFELGAFNFPVFAEGVSDPATLQTGSGYTFVFAESPRREAAVDFLRFLTSRSMAEAFTRLTDSPTAVRGVPEEAYSPLMRDTARLLAEAPGSFDYPPQSVGPQAAVASELAEVREGLMDGRVTPEAASERLEAASALVRARVADPGRVEVRHPVRGLVFAVAVVGVVAWVVWRVAGAVRRRGRAPGVVEPGRGMRGVTAVVFLTPALVLYAALSAGPAVVAFGWSLLRWEAGGEPSWAGLGNLLRLILESDAFGSALANSVFLAVVPTLVIVPVALVVAQVLHRRVPGAGVARAVLLFPNLLGGFGAAIVWQQVYEPAGGLLNGVIRAVAAWAEAAGWEGVAAWVGAAGHHPWLAPRGLYLALVPIYLWLATGFNAVLYLAAMEGVDRELYEAAELDGAGPWRQFVHVTLPAIAGTVGVSVVLLVIGGLSAFELVWLLTQQDPPQSAQTLGTWLVSILYREFDVGSASALGVVLAFLVLVVACGVRAVGTLRVGEAREGRGA